MYSNVSTRHIYRVPSYLPRTRALSLPSISHRRPTTRSLVSVPPFLSLSHSFSTSPPSHSFNAAATLDRILSEQRAAKETEEEKQHELARLKRVLAEHESKAERGFFTTFFSFFSKYRYPFTAILVSVGALLSSGVLLQQAKEQEEERKKLEVQNGIE